MSVQFINSYYNRFASGYNYSNNYNYNNFYNQNYGVNNYNCGYNQNQYTPPVNNYFSGLYANNAQQSQRNIGTYTTPMYANCSYNQFYGQSAYYARQATFNSRTSYLSNYYGIYCFPLTSRPNVVSRTTSVVSIGSATIVSGSDASSFYYYSSYAGSSGVPQTGTTTPSTTPKHKIAVIDYCDDSDADIDLDGDGKGDMAHGNVVAHLIDANVSDAVVDTYDITANAGYSENQRLVASLQSVLSALQQDSSAYEALNMSLSSRIKYPELSKKLGVTINNSNVSLYQDAIRDWLLNNGASNGYSTTAQVVKLLEQIGRYGVDIYIAAANVNDGTDDELNLYSIAKNTTTVGANSASGGKASFSFNNSLIDTWALGEIEVKKIKNASGALLGYDINNDGIVDISGSYTSGGTNSQNPFLKGTSFATPYKLSSSVA